ncbi:unnamed protein product, partial [Onchocerca ochengi]
ASTLAYSAAVYAKQGTETFLIFAKSRIASIKSMTIPRLELLAILIGVRAAQFVLKQLDLKPVQVTLCKLGNYQQWWKGPKWLAGDERDWPLWEFNFKENDEEVNVIAKARKSTIARGSLKLLDASRFSKWTKLEKGDFTAEDYRVAVMLLIKQAQTEGITEEEINLFYDEEDGVWRLRGRLRNSELESCSLHPIYLPAHNP